MMSLMALRSLALPEGRVSPPGGPTLSARTSGMRSNATSAGGAAARSAKWSGRRGGGKLPDAHRPAELGVRPLSPLVLQAGHVGEVGTRDEHVARVDRLPEVDDGAIPLVVTWSSRSCRRACPSRR